MKVPVKRRCDVLCGCSVTFLEHAALLYRAATCECIAIATVLVVARWRIDKNHLRRRQHTQARAKERSGSNAGHGTQEAQGGVTLWTTDRISVAFFDFCVVVKQV